MADQYKALHPLNYYKYYLDNNIRPDGRDFNKFRPLVLNLGSISTADGSALAKIGRTSVVCGIKAELCKPKAETPDQGFIVPNLELPPLCSSKFKSGPPSDQAQVYSQLISDILKDSKCIDLKDLCIHPDKLAWCLYIDLICLDFDGSVVDACIIAIMGALKSVQLPTIEYDPLLDNRQVNLEEKKPLHIYTIPVSTTFVIFDNKYILVDPTVEEENLCTGIISIVICENELCFVHKPGGTPLVEEELLKCIEKSKNRSPFVQKMIKAALESL